MRFTMPSMRPSRLAGAMTAAALATLLAWSPVLAAVSWGTVHRASPDYTYTWADSLARTTTSTGTVYLHEVYTQYVINGATATDSGPYLGVYYRRGNVNGSTWGTPKRLNPSTTHGDRATVAKSGKYVYVAWRRQAGSNGSTWNGVAPQPLQFRRNTSHGSSSAWKAQPSFTAANTIDRPSIAVSGVHVYIVYTDMLTGEIRLQVSADYGASFVYAGAIGATTATREGGLSGRPVIAVSGSAMGIAWFNGTTTRVKISTNAGASFGIDTDLIASGAEWLDAASSSGHLGFAWTDSNNRSLYVRTFNGTTLGATRTVLTLSDATAYKVLHHPSIAMTATSVIGVSYEACTSIDCSASGAGAGSAIRWVESRNGGATWSKQVTVGSQTASTSRTHNEWSSAIFAGSTGRIVLWSAYGNGSSAIDRQVVRVGTGAP